MGFTGIRHSRTPVKAAAGLLAEGGEIRQTGRVAIPADEMLSPVASRKVPHGIERLRRVDRHRARREPEGSAPARAVEVGRRFAWRRRRGAYADPRQRSRGDGGRQARRRCRAGRRGRRALGHDHGGRPQRADGRGAVADVRGAVSPADGRRRPARRRPVPLCGLRSCRKPPLDQPCAIDRLDVIVLLLRARTSRPPGPRGVSARPRRSLSRSP